MKISKFRIDHLKLLCHDLQDLADHPGRFRKKSNLTDWQEHVRLLNLAIAEFAGPVCDP